jgi:hypothetical protein
VRGICSPAYAKISRRNLQYPAACGGDFLLMFRGAKGTYLLMYLFVLPLILEMPMVFKVWLGNPPEQAILFTRLILIDVLIESISYPIMAVLQAIGKMRMYQSIVGGILLLNLPIYHG